MRTQLIHLALTALLSAATATEARTPMESNSKQASSAALDPAECVVNHDVGKLGIAVSNDGTIGNFSTGNMFYDCFTLETIRQGEYPIGSNCGYVFGGALWIGAIKGNDTLVSTGADGWARAGNEFHPDSYENGGGIIYRSTIDPHNPAFEGAISEQDYMTVYRDTCRSCYGVSKDPLDNRGHIPLNLEVTQRSFAWSYPQADDFVLVDYAIKNIGSIPVQDLCVGLFMDQDIHDLAMDGGTGAQDDISGLWVGSTPVSRGLDCEARVDLEMPWSADNDGDLNQSIPVYRTVPNVLGVRFLNLGGTVTPVTFNWWVSNADFRYDWGPTRRSNARDFTTGGSGTPEGDRNKYYLLRNGDRDYDQVRTATLNDPDSIWIPPDEYRKALWAAGLDTRYLVSGGSFTLESGQTIPFTVAFVGGENLHTSGANFQNLPYNPDAYLAGLDFSDFLNNGVWAGWVYDNPGVDTDTDGYAGQYQLCGDDTLWYEGDGIPDWCAVTAPVAPKVWIEPRDHALHVRWNGWQCESLVDWATRQTRFEGYRLHISSDGGPGSFSAIGSYDIEDYYRYYWDFGASDWVRSAQRMTFEETQCRYAPAGCADPGWDPLDYTRQAPYVMPGYPDSLLYFLPIFANASQFGLETPFLKRFPDAVRPVYDRSDQVPEDSVSFYLTEDGYFKFDEYECLIDDLIPGQPYWVAVSSFDWGSQFPGAEPLESPVWKNALEARPTGNCCVGIVGNANGDGHDEVSIGDVSLMIDARFIGGSCDVIPCLSEADINQSGGINPTCDDISIGDISWLIDYLFITGPSLGLPECL